MDKSCVRDHRIQQEYYISCVVLVLTDSLYINMFHIIPFLFIIYFLIYLVYIIDLLYNLIGINIDFFSDALFLQLCKTFR